METSMCRVCSSTRASQYISAFQDIVRIERKYCTFIFLVHDCLQIQIKQNDTLGTKICETCAKKLVSFFHMKESAKKIQNKLQMQSNLDMPSEQLNLQTQIKDEIMVEVSKYLEKRSSLRIQESKDGILISGTEKPVKLENTNIEDYQPTFDLGDMFENSMSDYTYGKEDKIEKIHLARPRKVVSSKSKPTLSKSTVKKPAPVKRRSSYNTEPFALPSTCVFCDLENPSTQHVKKCTAAAKAGSETTYPGCHFCQKKFGGSDRKYLYPHHLNMHIAFKFLLERDLIKFHECLLCQKVFADDDELNQHMENHETNPLSKSGDIRCNFCCAEYATPELIKEHMFFKHLQKFVCPVDTCKQEHKKYGFFYFHLQMSHSGLIETITDFECYYCNKIFSSYTLLDRHRKTTGECEGKKFPCTHCTKVFGTKDWLRSHMREVENPKFCEVCAKSFLTATQLKMHQRSHTGIRPFKCNVCDKSFITGASRSAHSRTHQTEKTIGCNECNFMGKSNRDVQNHKVKVHSGKFPCVLCDSLLSSRNACIAHIRMVHQLAPDDLNQIKCNIKAIVDS